METNNEKLFHLNGNRNNEELLGSILNRLQDLDYCDISIITNNGTFKSNSLILASISTTFEYLIKLNRTKSQSGNIIMDHIDRQHMKCILEFIYNGKTYVEKDDLPYVFDLGRYLNIDFFNKPSNFSLVNKGAEEEQERVIIETQLRERVDSGVATSDDNSSGRISQANSQGSSGIMVTSDEEASVEDLQTSELKDSNKNTNNSKDESRGAKHRKPKNPKRILDETYEVSQEIKATVASEESQDETEEQQSKPKEIKVTENKPWKPDLQYFNKRLREMMRDPRNLTPPALGASIAKSATVTSESIEKTKSNTDKGKNLENILSNKLPMSSMIDSGNDSGTEVVEKQSSEANATTSSNVDMNALSQIFQFFTGSSTSPSMVPNDNLLKSFDSDSLKKVMSSLTTGGKVQKKTTKKNKRSRNPSHDKTGSNTYVDYVNGQCKIRKLPSHVAKNEDGTVKFSQSGKPMVSCQMCDQVLSDASSLYRHQKIHTDVKPHSCPICGNSFIQRYNMRQHLRVHRKLDLNSKQWESLEDDLKEALLGFIEEERIKQENKIARIEDKKTFTCPN